MARRGPNGSTVGSRVKIGRYFGTKKDGRMLLAVGDHAEGTGATGA